MCTPHIVAFIPGCCCACRCVYHLGTQQYYCVLGHTLCVSIAGGGDVWWCDNQGEPAARRRQLPSLPCVSARTTHRTSRLEETFNSGAPRTLFLVHNVNADENRFANESKTNVTIHTTRVDRFRIRVFCITYNFVRLHVLLVRYRLYSQTYTSR